jgi:hypothetical protein
VPLHVGVLSSRIRVVLFARDVVGGRRGSARHGVRERGRVWSLVVVVVDVGVEHASEVCFTEDEDSVEAFGVHGADEAPTHPHWEF